MLKRETSDDRTFVSREPLELESFCKKQDDLEKKHPPYIIFFEAIRALLHCQNGRRNILNYYSQNKG